MKNIFVLLILIQFGFLYSQKSRIDKTQIIPRNIEFNGNVKKITLKIFDLNKKSDKIDTTKTISEIYFSKQKKITKINKYDKSLDNLWNITELDDLERITSVSRKNGDKMFKSVNQYYSTVTEYPDSTSIYFNETYKEKYINHFKNNLVVKQDHFINGLLQDYRLYKYNDKNQLIEDMYLNPENDSDETVVSKSDNELAFYPERLTQYEYKIIKDTLISITNRPKYNLKVVNKSLKTKKYSLEITEDYDDDYLKNSRHAYTYKDSIKVVSYYYKNKKEIKDYFITTTTENKIISKWKIESTGNNEERNDLTSITIVFDKSKNWIRKTFTKENQITRIIEREIEYY